MIPDDEDPIFNIRLVMELRDKEPIQTKCELCEQDINDSSVPAETAMLTFWGMTTKAAERYKKNPRLGRRAHMICADMKACMGRIRKQNEEVAACHDKRIKYVLSHVVAPELD